MTKSPLEEADPTSLNELFKRDPLDLSDEDVDMIAKKMREHRTAFAKEEIASEKEGRRRKKVRPDKPLSDDDILSNLKLDL